MTIEQTVSIVAGNATDINTEISAQNANGFIAVSITPSGSDVIILFQKTTLS